MQYPFPGNIRELENIIERSIALETSNIILPENLILDKKTWAIKETFIPEMSDVGLDLNDELARFEKRLIEQGPRKGRWLQNQSCRTCSKSVTTLCITAARNWGYGS